MSKWEELLKVLEINIETHNQFSVGKLVLWYSQYVSKEPPFNLSTTNENKLIVLKKEISHFLDTVYEIPEDKCTDTFEHLGGINAIQYASKKGYDVYLSNVLKSNKGAVNLTTSGQLTPLHLAAFYGHHLASKALLEYGAKSSVMTRLKQSPAYLALSLPPSIRQDERSYLIERKKAIFYDLIADNSGSIFSIDDSANTLAHIAAENGFIDVLEYLLQHSLDLVRMKNHASHTSLHSAILSNQFDSINVLIKDNELLAIADKHGRLPIHYAAMYSNSSMLESFARAPYLDSLDLNLKTPLISAAEQRCNENVKLLIEKGANVKSRDQYGRDVLHYAVMTSNSDLAMWLLTHVDGLNINQKDKYGRTGLMDLLRETKFDSLDIDGFVNDLLKAGAQPDLTDNDGKSLQDYLDLRFTKHSVKTVV